jgi:hypothetical protein
MGGDVKRISVDTFSDLPEGVTLDVEKAKKWVDEWADGVKESIPYPESAASCLRFDKGVNKYVGKKPFKSMAREPRVGDFVSRVKSKYGNIEEVKRSNMVLLFSNGVHVGTYHVDGKIGYYGD